MDGGKFQLLMSAAEIPTLMTNMTTHRFRMVKMLLNLKLTDFEHNKSQFLDKI